MKKRYVEIMKRILVTALSVSMALQPCTSAFAAMAADIESADEVFSEAVEESVEEVALAAEEDVVIEDVVESEVEMTAAGEESITGEESSAIYFYSAEEDAKDDPVSAEAKNDYAIGEKYSDYQSYKVGTNDFLTVHTSTKMKFTKVDDKYQKGYVTREFSFGGNSTYSIDKNDMKNCYSFSVSQNEAVLKVKWKCGDNGRYIVVVKAEDIAKFGTTGTLPAPKDLVNAYYAYNEADWGEETAHKKNEVVLSSFQIKDPGEYYLLNIGGQNNFGTIKLVDGPTPKIDWAPIAAPEITKVEVNPEDKGKISITVAANVNEDDAAESVTVRMYDKDGNIVASGSDMETGDEHVIDIAPDKSDVYKFKAFISRANCTDKESAFSSAIDYVRPLDTPVIASVANKGNETVKVAWDAIKEANYYIVKVSGLNGEEASKKVTDTYATVSWKGLAADTDAEIVVTAYRDKVVDADIDISKEGRAKFTTSNIVEEEWGNASFGTSSGALGTATNGVIGSLKDKDENGNASVRIYSVNGSGKIVPLSTDGITLHYLPVDPKVNFTMSGIVHVNAWNYTNGQDGFGIGAFDRKANRGSNEIKDFWNNSFMTVVTKSEYNWDPDNKTYTDDTTFNKYRMYLGVSSIARYGVTESNVADFERNSSVAMEKYGFYQDQTPLENIYTSGYGDGRYNLVGNHMEKKNLSSFKTYVEDYADYYNTYDPASGIAKSGSISDPNKVMTNFKMTVEKNNTGYYLSYQQVDENGTPISGTKKTNKYPIELKQGLDDGTSLDWKKDPLTQLDSDNIYVGFFAARSADITVTNVTYEERDPKTDKVREGAEITYKTNTSGFQSSSYSNTQDYNITYLPTWDGNLVITNDSGKTLYEGRVSADKYVIIPTTLAYGTNKFKASFTPDKDYHYQYGYDTYGAERELKYENPAFPEFNLEEYDNAFRAKGEGYKVDAYTGKTSNKYVELNTYDSVNAALSVNYRSYGEPDTYLYVTPEGTSDGRGTIEEPLDIYTAVKYVQPGQTILLAGGTYKLNNTVRVDRGINGTAQKPIRMMVDPEDFAQGQRAVFDFMGLAASSGFIIGGNYWYIQGLEVTNTKDQQKGIICAGNYNTLENIVAHHCGNNGIDISRMYAADTSDSDFWPHDNYILNCTSYQNSDAGYEDADGFTCKLTCGLNNVFDGCIAHHNADDGWDLYSKSESGMIGRVIIKNSVVYANGYITRDGETFSAGNGNGFKMGGEALYGGHTVVNCFSFMNKAKGIDSNSCPDIKAYNTVAYNNGYSNVAMTTNNGKFTDYDAKNVISLRYLPDDATDDEVEKIYGIRSSNGAVETAGDNVQWNKATSDTPVETVTYNTNGVERTVTGPVILADTAYLMGRKTVIQEQYDDIRNYENVYLYPKGSSKDAALKDWMEEHPGYTDEQLQEEWIKTLKRITSPVNGTTNKRIYKEMFKSLEFDRDNGEIQRNADGTVNMGDFLMLTDEAEKELGFGFHIGETHDDIAQLTGIDCTAHANGTDGKYLYQTAENLVMTSGSREIAKNDSDKAASSLYNDVESLVKEDKTVVPGVIKDQYFTGKPIKPELLIYDGLNKQLVEGRDYTVQYINNTNVGTAKVVVRGKGNYTGKVYTKQAGESGEMVPVDNLTFNILPVSLSESFTMRMQNKESKIWENISVIDTDDAYSEPAPLKVTKPSPSVEFYNGINTRKLKTGKEFTVEYYAGTLKESDVEKEKLASAIDSIPSDTPEKAAEYTIVLRGAGNFGGVRCIPFTVYNPANTTDISTASIDPIEVQLLDGSKNGNRPFELIDKRAEGKNEKYRYQIKVNDKVLTPGVDFTVKYRNNKKKGTATARITGKGEYTGTTTVKFKIQARKLTPNTVSVNDAECLDSLKTTVLGEEKIWYTGEKLTFNKVLRVYDKGEQNDGTVNKRLSLGRDYVVSYKREGEVGKATATLIGKGAYAGAFRISYAIYALQVNKLLDNGLEVKLNGDKVSTADGKEIDAVKYQKRNGKINVTISYNGINFKLGRDFKVGYVGNQVISDAKNGEARAKATITFKRGLFGTPIARNYAVIPGEFDSNSVYLTATDVKYKNAKTKLKTKPTVIEYASGKKLKPGVDFDTKLTFKAVDSKGNEIKFDKDGNALQALEQGSTLYDPAIFAEGSYDLQVTATSLGKYYEEGTVSTKIHIAGVDIRSAKIKPLESVEFSTYEDDKNAAGVEIDGNAFFVKDKETKAYLNDEGQPVSYQIFIPNSETGAKEAMTYYVREGVGANELTPVDVYESYQYWLTLDPKSEEGAYQAENAAIILAAFESLQSRVSISIKGTNTKLLFAKDFTIATTPDTSTPGKSIKLFNKHDKIGKANVTIQGINGYTGVKLVAYQIKPRNLDNGISQAAK